MMFHVKLFTLVNFNKNQTQAYHALKIFKK